MLTYLPDEAAHKLLHRFRSSQPRSREQYKGLRSFLGEDRVKYLLKAFSGQTESLRVQGRQVACMCRWCMKTSDAGGSVTGLVRADLRSPKTSMSPSVTTRFSYDDAFS